MKIEVVNKVPEEIEEKIIKDWKNQDFTYGIDSNFSEFAIILKDEESDTVVGLLKAWTIYSEVYVDTLWIEPKCRKKGLGRLLLSKLEKNFEGKGFWNINLCTAEFQAPEFYKKCGYELEFIRKNFRLPKLTKYFFIKYFKEEKQNAGILQDS